MRFCNVCGDIVEKGIQLCEDCKLHRRRCKECGKVYRIDKDWANVKLCPSCFGVKDVNNAIYVAEEDLLEIRGRSVSISKKIMAGREHKEGNWVTVDEAAKKRKLSAIRIRQLVNDKWIREDRRADIKYKPLLVDYNEIVEYLKLKGRRVFSHGQRMKQIRELVERHSDAFEIILEERNREIRVSFSGIGWRPNKTHAAADFILKIGNEVIYGEIGGISIDKIFTYYRDKRMLWVSKDRPDWKDHSVYFDNGRCVEVSLYDFLNFLLEKYKK